MSISLDAANALESAIDGKIRQAAAPRRRASGTVSRVDKDGTVYAVLESGIETVVEGLTASVNPGDTVNVTIEGGRAEVLGNYSDPSAGVQYVRAVEGIATEAGATAHAAVDSAAAARQVADEANKVAQATNQHFFADTNGAHITDVTQDEWNDAVADNFSDYDPTTKPYHNQLLNSLGILLRTALNNLVSITRSAIAFYDGTGNAAANIVARFGSDGAQIGKSGAAHIDVTQYAMSVYESDSAVGEKFIAGLANAPSTGLAKVELRGVFDSVITQDGVSYYAINHDGIRPVSYETLEIDGTEHALTGISYSDMYMLFDQTEYAVYSGSTVRLVYTTADPVPTLFFGTSYNISGVHTGANSAVFGKSSSALGIKSFASGQNANANGTNSRAFGTNVNASGEYSSAIGYYAETSEKARHGLAVGYDVKAKAFWAESIGRGVVSQNADEMVIGTYNDYANDTNPYGRSQYNNKGKYALVIGNGTADNARSNAATVSWAGDIEAAGDITDGGGNTLADKLDASTAASTYMPKTALTVDTYTQAYTAAANSLSGAITIDVSKTGYTPLGIVGFACGSSGAAIEQAVLDGTDAKLYIRNVTSSAISKNCTINVLYMAVV